MKDLQKLPEFSLFNDENQRISIKDLKGDSRLVIYFYPKNESKICTDQSCSFRDTYQEFIDNNIKVVGINNSSPSDLSLFRQNHHLPFPLLSDPNYKVHKLFGVMNFLGISGRETFLFDKDDTLIYKFNSMFQGKKHVSNILNKINS